jgi:hypothetical protein
MKSQIKLIVHVVMKNVSTVIFLLKTVLLVLLEESLHQLVISHHQNMVPLLLTMFQLVLLKLSTVLVLVKLVLDIQINVNLVTSIELTHHPVCVLMVSIPILQTNVLNVTSDVLLVMPFLMTLLQVVLYVPLIELILQDVVAEMDNMMIYHLLTVKIVTIDVQPVTLSVTVPVVDLTDGKK